MPSSFNLLRYLRQFPPPASGAELTDGQLLEAFLTRGEDVGFAVLLRRYAPMVWSLCQRHLGPSPDCEDSFQAVFLLLVAKGNSIRPREKVGNWLHGVAVKVALKARRQRDRLHRRHESLDEVPDPTTSDPVPTADLAALLDTELLKLPEKHRAVIIGCDLQGRTRQEVARQLGLAEGTVSSRLARAREQLRQRLTRRGITLPATLVVVPLVQTLASMAPPAVLTQATLRMAWISTENAGALGLVPGPVANLMKGALPTMFLSKCKLVGAGLLMAALVAGGAGALSYRLLAQPVDGRAVTASAAENKPAQGDRDKGAREPAPDKGRMVKLLKERRDAAWEEYNARWQEVLAGRGVLDLCIRAALNLRTSELEQAGNHQERVAAYQAQFERMKSLHQLTLAKFEAGRASIADNSQAKFQFLDAEIALERAKAK